MTKNKEDYIAKVSAAFSPTEERIHQLHMGAEFVEIKDALYTCSLCKGCFFNPYTCIDCEKTYCFICVKK